MDANENMTEADDSMPEADEALNDEANEAPNEEPSDEPNGSSNADLFSRIDELIELQKETNAHLQKIAKLLSGSHGPGNRYARLD
jgi:hypothetical protein